MMRMATTTTTRLPLLALIFLWTIQGHHGFQWQSQMQQHLHRPPCTKQSRKERLLKRHYQPDASSDNEENSKRRRRPLAFLSIPTTTTPSPLQRISRLWATFEKRNSSATSNDDEEIDFGNKTSNELQAQAAAWREKANAIRNEATAMESALQQTTSKRLEKKLEAVDDIIATLFSSKLTESQQQQQQQEQTQMEKTVAIAENQPKAKERDAAEMEIEAQIVVVPDPRVVADRLKNARYNQDQILDVVDRLYDLQRTTTTQASEIDTSTNNSTDDSLLTTNNTTEKVLYTEYLTVLTDAAAILDDGTAASSSSSEQAVSPSTATTSSRASSDALDDGRLEIAIRTRIKEKVKIDELTMKRQLTYGLQKAISDSNFTSVEGYLRNTFGLKVKFEGRNSTQARGSGGDAVDMSILDNVTTAETPLVPMWVPSVFLPYIISSNASTVGPTEVEIMEKNVLSGSRFYVTSSTTVPGAALFRGNIRSKLGRVIIRTIKTEDDDDDEEEGGVDNTTAVVFAEIQERMEAAGLGDKVQLFMMTDPETEPKMKGTRPAVTAMEEDTKPVILALSKALSPDESKMKKRPIQKLLKTWSYPATVLSTFVYSVSMFSLNPNFFDSVVNKRDLRALIPCIPFALSVFLVQTIHEAAHYLVAKKKNLKIGVPVPIPSFSTSLPLLGCITPLRSFPKNRAALLDFALSGPLSAITVSLGLVIFGALLTVRASQVQIARFPVMSVAAMKSSFLLGSVLSWLVPKTMMLPMAQPVPMHPFFVVGASGLVSNALNLLPIFRLDGGRACFAAVGPRQGAVISVFTLLLLVSMVLSGASSTLMTWTFLVAMLQRRQEIPPRDDVTEVDGKRLTLWLLSFLLSVSIVAPFPGFGMLNM